MPCEKKLKYRYNLTLQDYNDLITQQANACAVCFKPFTEDQIPHVDHCHETGKVRGALCRKCNLALGHLEDFPEVAESAATYLRKHNED